MAYTTDFDITNHVQQLLQGMRAVDAWVSVAQVTALLQNVAEFKAMDNKRQRSKIRAVFKKFVKQNQVAQQTGEYAGRATTLFQWTGAAMSASGCGSCTKDACAVRKAPAPKAPTLVACDATGHADVQAKAERAIAAVIKSLELHGDEPIVVAYGMGLDSTAMLVKMAEYGIVPDLIMFADTGAEKPETYAYLDTMNAWLKKVGFPQITIVRYKPKRASYNTLEEKLLANEVLPALAYGYHQCALNFKVAPQNKFVDAWQPAIEAWAQGKRVRKLIGYDSSAADLKRSKRNIENLAKVRAMVANGEELNASQQKLFDDNEKYHYEYPLQDWGLKRDQLAQIIKDAGLPVPMKSACYFCPASKKHEILWLRDNHPELFQRALEIEANALRGKHHDPAKRAANGKDPETKVKGLARNWSWADFAANEDSDEFDDSKIAMPAAG